MLWKGSSRKHLKTCAISHFQSSSEDITSTMEEEIWNQAIRSAELYEAADTWSPLSYKTNGFIWFKLMDCFPVKNWRVMGSMAGVFR